MDRSRKKWEEEMSRERNAKYDEDGLLEGTEFKLKEDQEQCLGEKRSSEYVGS